MRMEITEKLDGMKYKMTQYVLRAFKKRVMLAHLNYWRGVCSLGVRVCVGRRCLSLDDDLGSK